MARSMHHVALTRLLIIALGLGLLSLSMEAVSEAYRMPLAPIAMSSAAPVQVSVTSRSLGARESEVGDRAGVAGSVKSPSQPVSDDPQKHPESGHIPPGYVKVFADEFNEPRFDTRRWWTRYIYEDGKLDFLNDEQQRYRENKNHVMTGRSLILMARKVGDGGRTAYQSGMIRSRTTFKYGYFETRMKIPGGRGVRPAFWLNSARRESDGKIAWPPEIDIAELVNNGVEDTTRMLHVGLISHGAQQAEIINADPAFHRDWNYLLVPTNLADDFHVYGALWDHDDTVTIFLDGHAFYKARYKWVYDDGSPAGYAHVILDLAIGGPKWAGRHGIDDAAFPEGLEVDYVRVYQKAGQQMLGTDMVGKDLCPSQSDC